MKERPFALQNLLAMVSMDSPVTFGMVGARPVFMDERDDSYFMLQPVHEAEFLDLAKEAGNMALPLRRALGLSDQDSWPQRACSGGFTSSLLEQLPVHGGTSPLELLRAALALRWARGMLGTQSIEAILGSVRAGKAVTPTEAPLIAEASRFLAARRYLPSKPNCLVDSLALMRFLGPLAAGTTLIFGVKLEPFSAHCWVQFKRLLLNDRGDYVERFAPVRTVTCLAATH